MTVGVVIPSRANIHGLAAVIGDVQVDVGEEDVPIVVIDNGYGLMTDDPPSFLEFQTIASAEVLHDETASIYQLWNDGLSFLVETMDCDKVVFLNDDVRLIGNRWIERLIAPLNRGFMVTCPDWTNEQFVDRVETVHGTYRHHGMCGFAFAVDVHAALEAGALPFDEKYSWWYGDDDFTLRVDRAGGRIGRIGGLRILHEESTTLNKTDVSMAIANDTVRFRTMWGDQ